MHKIEHIGIAVQNLENAIEKYEILLNTPCYKTEMINSEQVNTAFFSVGDSKIELLASLDTEGVIPKFIAKRGEGLHHIAFEVTDIEKEIERLKQAGFSFINEVPKIGADNKLVCFIHPKTANGVLIELCQEIKS
ncbi:MAG: methylmalonyl-CoA epimerase [Hydrotalea flava]|uniref:methylmalonyl-CoA epimerase n=1 Tax=Hydrotalea TaxID=1004300 RepID=UPI00094549DD|nr:MULTISPECIES: methylmalonyl-CoA epimerase [Hydrotalea]NIM35965.1 methylmalonyl-CoA epimerase [Hydrotalea flava]NIM38798.1 methylmalonyl-CoA epimerase [Hydrotalea flava]NIN03986.1 methylmalonyl-CoA epimerase [Hydrotalea flava]NIN15707.1 methylmalonyl-CoA epimerase [Hydrotalea flava]NIO94724.1 methylmalonyl-CoA epimerase [Hydrotalea flava]